MKQNKILPLFALASTLLFGGCQKDEDLESLDRNEFLKSEQVGVYAKGKTLFALDKTTQVTYIDKQERKFRIMSDDGQSYLQVKLSGEPFSSGIYTCEFEQTEDININLPLLEDYQFAKYENGKSWLWSPSTRRGIILEWM